eukprot:805125-Prorocentrum_minimum.AAC.3
MQSLPLRGPGAHEQYSTITHGATSTPVTRPRVSSTTKRRSASQTVKQSNSQTVKPELLRHSREK